MAEHGPNGAGRWHRSTDRALVSWQYCEPRRRSTVNRRPARYVPPWTGTERAPTGSAMRLGAGRS